MLVAGALMNEKDEHGNYPLLKLFEGADDKPLDSYKVDALALILSPEVRTFVDLSVKQPISGNSALHLAISVAHLGVSLLVHRGADVNIKTKPGARRYCLPPINWRSQWFKITRRSLDICSRLPILR